MLSLRMFQDTLKTGSLQDPTCVHAFTAAGNAVQEDGNRRGQHQRVTSWHGGNFAGVNTAQMRDCWVVYAAGSSNSSEQSWRFVRQFLFEGLGVDCGFKATGGDVAEI